jgi:hypothetical protein
MKHYFSIKKITTWINLENLILREEAPKTT